MRFQPDPFDRTMARQRGGCVLTITGTWTRDGQSDSSTPVPGLRPEHADRGRQSRSGRPVSGYGLRQRRLPSPVTIRPDTRSLSLRINGVPFSGTGFGYNGATDSITDGDRWQPASCRSLSAQPSGSAAIPAAGPTRTTRPPTSSTCCWRPRSIGRPSRRYDRPDAALDAPAGAGPLLGGPEQRQHHGWTLLRQGYASAPGRDRQLSFAGRPAPSLWTQLAGSMPHPNFTGSNPDFNPLWDGVTPAGQPQRRPMGRGQRRGRGAGQRVGRPGDAGPLDAPTAGSTSRCSPSSASISTAG